MPRVRAATPDDTEAIVSVTVAGWREGYRGIVPPERLGELPIDRWRHEVGVGLRRPVADAFTRVAELDGVFIGYCYVAAPARDGDLGKEAAELVAIYVEPRHWRRGAGTALMGAALERLDQLGYGEAALWTFAANEKALAFYSGHGWEPDGEEKFHERGQATAIRLRRAVSQP